MKKFYVIAVLAVCSLGIQAQTKSHPRSRMSMTFSTLAIKCVREISNSTDTGSAYDKVTRSVAEAFNNASDAARGRDELAAVEMLRQFLDDKMTNNSFMNGVPTKLNSGTASSELFDQIHKEEVDIPRRELACESALDSMLRSGIFRELKACQNVGSTHIGDLL